MSAVLEKETPEIIEDDDEQLSPEEETRKLRRAVKSLTKTIEQIAQKQAEQPKPQITPRSKMSDLAKRAYVREHGYEEYSKLPWD